MSSIKHEAAARAADTVLPGPDAGSGPAVHDAGFADLDAQTLYALLRLRVDVFVVEQDCPYPELDGRDTEPTTRHLWTTRDGRVAAYVRLLRDPNGDARIGRVVTAPPARGSGFAAVLVRAAVERSAGRDIVLDAQAHLEAWYARFGFVRDGEGFVEDGIPHVPMRRTATGDRADSPDAPASAVTGRDRPTQGADPGLATPWPDADGSEKLRGGADYVALHAAQRQVQDALAGSSLPSPVSADVTARLVAVLDLLAPHQVPESERRDGFRPDLPGRGHPFLPPYEVLDEGDGWLRGTVVFGRFHLGGNAAAHGGAHPLLFDDVLGRVVNHNRPAMARTAFLTTNYRRVTPLDVELTFDVSLDRVEGRKRFASGRLTGPTGELLSDCVALFVELLPGQP